MEEKKAHYQTSINIKMYSVYTCARKDKKCREFPLLAQTRIRCVTMQIGWTLGLNER
jgi:hypothetical protein